MRQMCNLFIVLLVLLCVYLPVNAELNGGIDYSAISINYSNLDQNELETKAEQYYYNALSSTVLNDDMTSALLLYTVLSNKNPDKMIYALRLGKLYDVIGKNKQAKENYYRARELNPSSPEPYYYLGDYYYDREQYGTALKLYKKACERGYSEHYPTLHKITSIYEKFGDIENASTFLQP